MDLPDSLVQQSIGRGEIMHADIFEDIDHGKFFVVLSVVDANVGYFYINSNIGKYIQQRKQYLDMQMPMKPEQYPFLSYTSFLDATSIKLIRVNEVVESLQNGHCQRVGRMPAEDMERLLYAAQQSSLFSKKEKSTFLKL